MEDYHGHKQSCLVVGGTVHSPPASFVQAAACNGGLFVTWHIPPPHLPIMGYLEDRVHQDSHTYWPAYVVLAVVNVALVVSVDGT